MDRWLQSGDRRIRVRPVGAEGMDDLLAVYRQCEDFLALGPQPRASVEMIEADLALSRGQGGVFCGVYDDQGRLAGVLDYVPGGYLGHPGEAFLELLMLVAPYRGQGLGEALVTALHTHLAAAGIRGVRAGVQANNPGAQRFWQRMGYLIVGGPELLADGTTCYELYHAFDA